MELHIAERLSQCLRDAGADAQRRGENKISDSFFHSDDVSILGGSELSEIVC